jgi:hypothetical protein
VTAVVPPLAINTGYHRVLTDHGILIIAKQAFGPAGILLRLRYGTELLDGSLIVSQADYGDVEWLHASLAWEQRDPSHDEMNLLHRAVFGRRRWAYAVHAPADRHVDGTRMTAVGPGHEHALHLWGRVDGAPVLPDFVGDRGHL